MGEEELSETNIMITIRGQDEYSYWNLSVLQNLSPNTNNIICHHHELVWPHYCFAMTIYEIINIKGKSGKVK